MKLARAVSKCTCMRILHMFLQDTIHDAVEHWEKNLESFLASAYTLSEEPRKIIRNILIGMLRKYVGIFLIL